MNSDTMKGNWKQIKGKVKEQWGKLTDDHLTRIDGKRDQLTGQIQETYGIGRDEAHRQVQDFAQRNPGAFSDDTVASQTSHTTTR